LAQNRRARVKEAELSLEEIKKQLDILDQRLDAIDSIVTALAERMLKRPVSVTITCPNCGRIIEIAMVGNEKMMR
jgi:hypothetical protein